jgi:hypothetical protein
VYANKADEGEATGAIATRFALIWH